MNRSPVVALAALLVFAVTSTGVAPSAALGQEAKPAAEPKAVAEPKANADWKPVPGKLMTRWAKDVTPDKVLPEYPRPQMVRSRWQNLNGLWEYAIRAGEKPATQPAAATNEPKAAGPAGGSAAANEAKSASPTGPIAPATAGATPSLPNQAISLAADAPTGSWDGKILVPFPVESALSGVGKRIGPEQKLWYRRSFKVPADWRTDGQRVLLHFGAVDWETAVAVNGKPVGTHRGGFDPFSFDVTDALVAGDVEQAVTVAVADPTNASYQPRGKQVARPGGIYYTPTTGIWQTVWLEPVAKAYITGLVIEPDADNRLVRVLVKTQGENRTVVDGNFYSLSVFDGDTHVGGNSGPNAYLVGHLVPKLWTPDSPFLYRLVVKFGNDTVESYCAFRKISVGKDEKGITRILLNNKFVFQYGPLDQGFWPDGLFTAPTDAAMKYDLEVTKRLGFNMVRKHVKVEPARWYRYCDEMGLLVWQDMPSGDKPIGPRAAEDFKRSPESMANYEREWANIIDALRPFPCIVMWVPFNEGWGQTDTPRIVELTRKLDPTRLVDSASGWVDRGVGDVHDAHIYPGPGSPKPEEKRAAVLGEFGGLGLPVKGHTWQDEKNWGYRSYESAEALTDAYVALLTKMHPLIGDPGLSAAVYTQTTDVEVEVNGLMTYDREVLKLDEARITAAAKKLYGPPPVVTTLVPTAEEKQADWRYTTDKPADGWQAAAFDAAAWKVAPGGFGTKLTPGTTVRTEWSSADIWVRREFELPADFKPTDGVHLNAYHDEDAEIYLNGVAAAKGTGYTTAYGLMPIRAEARAALKPGKNVIAIHCHQTGGGQYIDAGLVQVK